MRLDSLTLENYRRYERLSIKFGSGFNVIIGSNGSGKTTILKAAREVLFGYAGFVPIGGGNFGMFGDPGAARVAVSAHSNGLRFEEQFPMSVSAVGECFGREHEWKVIKQTQTSAPGMEGLPPGANMSTIFAEGTASDIVLPIIAFYAANRMWASARPNEMAAATSRQSRSDGYSWWTEASSDSISLQQWVISKSLERMQFATDRGVKRGDIQDDELAMVNVALAHVVEGAREIRFDFSQKSIVIEWVGERPPTLFENLSDGQRVAISLVLDIARRMCILNPQLGRSVTALTPGVVLIDELDVHLHPKWQRIVTKGLQTAFPAVQFIATTHSPQIIGELKPEEIIVLDQDGYSYPQVSYGLDASKVLELVMGAEQRSSDVEERLSQIFELIEKNAYADARASIASLRSDAPGLPELAGAEALIKRKELLGR